MQYKQMALHDAKIKAIGDDGERIIEGYASMFGGVDAHGDRVVRGAYTKTLQDRQRPVRMRWNHFGPVIGKWLKMKEDEYGLKVTGSLTPGHSVAEDAYASLQHGAVDTMSIGYHVVDEKTVDGVNELREIDLIEISLVEEPADLGAMVTDVKNAMQIIENIGSLKDFEAYLRHGTGLSRSAATALASRVKAICQSDSDIQQEQKQSDSVAHDLLMQHFSDFDLMKHYIQFKEAGS